MSSLTAIPERNNISAYDINYYRAVFALAAISYLLLTYYLIPAESSIKEFLLEGRFIAIIPFSLLIATFIIPVINKYLPLIVNFIFLFSTLHLLGFIAVNEFAGKYETILIALILIANLHLEKIVFVVLYNVITVTVLEYVFIMTAPSPNVQPALFFVFLIAAMLVSIPYQLYRIRYISNKKETDILNEGLLKGNPDAWLLLDGPGLVVKEASDKALELFGIKSIPELEQISLRSLIASTTTIEADNIIRSILSNSSFDTVTLCRKVSGELFHADVSTYKIPGENKYIQCRFIETSKSRWNKENQDATENAIRYRSYLDLAEIGMIICDNSGKIRICNKHVARFFKLDPGQNFADQQLEKLTGVEIADSINLLLAKIKSTKIKSLKETISTDSQNKLTLTVSLINDIIDFSEEFLILVEKEYTSGSAITKSPAFETITFQGENAIKPAFTFEFLPFVITGNDGKIRSSNAAFDQLTGYNAEELLNLKIERIIHPEDLSAFNKFISDKTKTDSVKEIEMRIISKTNQTIYLNTASEIIDENRSEIRFLFYDITRFKIINDSLLNANSNVTAVVENTDDPIFSVDFNHRITVMNSAFEKEYTRRLGRKPAAGEDFRKLISKNELLQWNKGFEISMKGNKFRQDEVINYPDSSVEYFETSFHPITSNENLVIGVSVHSRKVTDRIRFEKEIISAKEVAEKATNAKSDFLATMSHEIRTPLNGLLGMSQLLNSTNLSGEQKEFVDSIQISGEALLSVINDVLDYSRIESEKLELEEKPFELNSVISETFNILNYKAKDQGNTLASNISNNLPHYYIGDKARLRQILVNLVGNAIKFTNNGKIDVNITGTAFEAGKWELQFAVRDTGIGMNEDQIKKLFQSFSQADSSTFGKYGGSGLGLSISSKLAALMHGRMWVESKPGEGSVFFFTIQISETSDKGISSLQNGNSATRDPEENKKIAKLYPLRLLVAEDNMVNQTLAKATFKTLGYTIDIAENGQRAVELALTKVYDVIFMDVQMPLMNGMEATAEIHQQLKSDEWPVIIAMTAFALEGDRQKCIDAGMNDYLSKPFIIEDIKRLIIKYGRQLSKQPVESIPQATPKLKNGEIELIDYTMIDRLKVMADDDPAFLGQLVELFISQSDDTVVEIQNLYSGKDFKKLSQAAHKLKGSSLNLGAKQLAELCKQIEFGADNNNDEHIAKQLSLMGNIYAMTKTALKSVAGAK